MKRHSEDGLAFQRYGRAKQDGLGDDILSGNSLSVVGLYQAIYGINPLYNRFYLNPHITPELSGTELNYNFRGEKLKIGLKTNSYSVANKSFKITSHKHFGFFAKENELSYFEGDNAAASLIVKTNNNLSLEINKWNKNEMVWTQTSSVGASSKIVYTLNKLIPNTNYQIRMNAKLTRTRSNNSGTLILNSTTGRATDKIIITKDK